ncbi:BnaC07g49070D [Brassica napus]|uniref:BnaC07g49070D protein n=1 Tax=Brassica napus TaxID=3708 RepID=A0A078ITM8_BRANA|nr:BnaC07g49070D [Brassica napus]
MKRGGIRRKRLFGRTILFTSVVFFIGFGLLLLTLRSVDDPNSSSSSMTTTTTPFRTRITRGGSILLPWWKPRSTEGGSARRWRRWEASSTVVSWIRASEFEMLSVAIFTSTGLQQPGIYWGKYPFGDYIAYSNDTFTLSEVKHLWRQKGCVKKYGRRLVMRLDDFEKPAKSNVLCSNWKKWEEAIIWFQGTTDAVASQFFLKNVHPEMRAAAVELFGEQGSSTPRANVFGELMMSLISPTKDVKDAVDWVLRETGDPDISLHMRMLMSKSVRPLRAAVNCLGKAVNRLGVAKPRVVIVSDTPSVVKNLELNISSIAEVLHFDYKLFRGDIAQRGRGLPMLDFRIKDWGPAPRWVAFVDFFLACRAKHAVISGAHRRVGTTYAQLVAALGAANSLKDGSSNSSFAFLSSFQSNLLADGLKNQVGWGHVWNRYAGPLSCPKQPNQCAFTPLAPPGWWDGLWQSPIPRDARKLAAYGVELSGFGTVNEDRLHAFCNAKKAYLSTVTIV